MKEFAGMCFLNKVWEFTPNAYYCGDGSTFLLGLVKCLVGSRLLAGLSLALCWKGVKLRLEVTGEELACV